MRATPPLEFSNVVYNVRADRNDTRRKYNEKGSIHSCSRKRFCEGI